MKRPRSIVFYAWLGLAADLLLVAGTVAFVLVGGAYQRSAVLLLSQRIERTQLANLTLQSEFLNTQRALRGYQATGQARFLQTFYSGQPAFVLELAALRKLAWPSVQNGVIAQEQAAHAAFLSGSQAAEVPPGSHQAAALYERASASSDSFVQQNQRLQVRLTGYRTAVADTAQRTLGVGMLETSIILSVGLVLPVAGFGLALRWTSAPLSRLTSAVRKQALGDHEARAVIGGPADVQELARSVNLLADESDRLRSVRQAATRIYEHLHAPAIISEAVGALKDNLAVDTAWVGLVRGEELAPIEDLPGKPPRGATDRQAGSATWIRELFGQRPSFCVQNLCAGIPAGVPPPICDLARGPGAASLLLAVFGIGKELTGVLALVRNAGGHEWIGPEIEAVESLACDIGRALEHASLYEGEERHVTELQSLDRAKTGFLASASHELRTPLTSIVGNVEVLRELAPGPLTTRQATMLDAVSRNGRRLQNLIEDMLASSNIQLGWFTSNLAPIDLVRLIPEQVDLATPVMQARGITFSVTTPPEMLMVNGDAGQLSRVLMNLLTNAAKYTPTAGRVSCAATAVNGHAVLCVADTGMGIPEAEQESVGVPFFRASNAIANAIQGSGLGLSIVRKVVANHGGSLELKSAEGSGTEITIRIPLLPAAACANVALAQKQGTAS